jgi:hypothetical protein
MNFTELEKMMRGMGAEMARKLLASRLEEDPRGHPDEDIPCVCPKCKGKLKINRKGREQRRVINTPLGDIAYRRAYGQCDHCGFSGAPLDEALGIPHSGPSVGALRKVSHASVVAGSFEKGADVLKEQAEIIFCRQYVRTLAEEEGKRLVREHDEAAKLYQEHKLEVKSQERPQLIVVCADGGRIQTRQPENEERWKEDKIGAVYDAEPRSDSETSFEKYKGAEAKTKTYVATMEPWEKLGWKLRLEAEQRGYSDAGEKLFLGDGAKPIREIYELHFKDATFILDWCHAAGHLSDSAKAAFGEGTQKALQGYAKLKDMLWAGKADAIIAQLQEKSKRLGEPQKGDTDNSPRVVLRRNAYSYFPNNREAINYPYFRSQGWPIGSGIAEGAVKQFNLRMKGSDKSWNISNTGAEEMLQLCALYYSEDDRWDRYWQRRAQPQQKE